MLNGLVPGPCHGEFGLLAVGLDHLLIGADPGKRCIQRRLADPGATGFGAHPGQERAEAILGTSRQRGCRETGEQRTAAHQNRTDAASEPKLNSPDFAVRNSCVCQTWV